MPRKISADGKTIVVPDDATDEEINQIAGPAQPAPSPGISPHTPSIGDMAMRAGGAFAENLNPLPAIQAIAHPIDTARSMFNATTDAVGRTREAFGKGQYGESAKSAIGAIPVIGPAAEQIAREGTGGKLPEAIGHAGAFFAAPKVAKGVGGILTKAAEPMAESALGIRAVQRAYGKTPGLAALEETSGVRPATVAASAQSKLGQLTPQLEAAASASKAPTNLQPAIDLIRNQSMKLKGQNQRLAVQQLAPMEEHLTKSVTSGMPLSRTQSPRGLLELKRGFGDEFIHNWNPETMTGTRGTAGRVYHELGKEFERAVPDAAPLNQRISSLIPVSERAEAVDRNAGFGQRVAHRIGAHTGALAGAALGFHEGGIPGGIAGLVIPELLASPTAKMAGARLFYGAGRGIKSPAGTAAARAIPIIQDRNHQ